MENLLFDKESGKIKLIDFGFSRMFLPGKRTFEDGVGTLSYIAPEILAGNDFDLKCDLGMKTISN